MADAVETKTTEEILGDSPLKDVLKDIFADLDPRLIDTGNDIAGVFTPQAANDFLAQLTNFEDLLDEEDDFKATVEKLQSQIDEAEEMRDQLLASVFEKILPIERSYRELMMFFENSKVPDGKVRKPVELYCFNGDATEMKDVFAMGVAAIEHFVRNRNDNFNFRDDICNLVIPGAINQPVREKFEDIANAYGMLLVTDLDDETSFKNIERQFLPGGKYEFMKRPEDRAAADVVLAGYLQLRQPHWFEKDDKGKPTDGLWGPPSLVFAGAVARADDGSGIAQGPVGSRFGQISGSEACRVEPLISEMEHLSMERQLIPIIRDADNHLCFFGCRTQAEDPYGVLKFFTSYRILRYLERCCRHYLLQVAGQTLTRNFMDEQIEKPLRRLLEDQVREGTLLGYELFVDKDSNKRMQGICDITMNVMPTGPGETFVLKIDTPDFEPQGDSKN